jgi:hypothetical protein
MITRHHNDGATRSWSSYSDCENYRYVLERVWNPDGAKLTYIMLNPSKATEQQNDPTIERCERRARQLGYGAFRVCNIFAWRETDPRALRQADAPVGPDKDTALKNAAVWADTILCGWGVHGAHQNRGPETASILRASGQTLWSLGLSKHGHPRHPLYIAYVTQPEIWEP